MLCINNNCIDPYFNLAAEEYLLKNFTEDIFMLWQNKPSVIIGKNQDVWAEINQKYVDDRDIKVVRRYTGGGAVYHDLGNINLTFIENYDSIDFGKFKRAILNFLKTIDIHADVDERGSITINRLKISGSAQCIHKGRMMYHATLLFSSDLTNLTSTLDNDKERSESNSKKYVKSKKSPVTNISDCITVPHTIEEFKELAYNHFRTKANTNYIFNEDDIKVITQLSDEKYATTVWNFNEK